MRKVFFETFENMARENKEVFFLIGDLGIKFADSFKKVDATRFINCGVAESNMIGVAAGLALSGKKPYCYSIIPFLTMRTLEQIRIDVCYHNLDVKLLGAGGGLVYGKEGVTHHSIEDIAIMRSLPNMTVVAPGDVLEAQALAQATIKHKGPLYIRFGRDSNPSVHNGEIKFEIGKGIVVKEEGEVCLIATGTMLYQAKLVSNILADQGIASSLVSMHTIKPLDEELIKSLASKYKAIFTLEEHSIIGGLGSAVAEVLAENKYQGIFKRIGIQDQFSSSLGMGGPDYLLKINKLDPESISIEILNQLKNK